MSKVREFMEGKLNFNSLNEQEEPPEAEMKEYAREVSDIVQSVTGRNVGEISSDLMFGLRFEFRSGELQDLTGSTVYDEEVVQGALNNKIQELEDAFMSNLSSEPIESVKFSDSTLYPITINLKRDYTEYSIKGKPGDWQVVI